MLKWGLEQYKFRLFFKKNLITSVLCLFSVGSKVLMNFFLSFSFSFCPPPPHQNPCGLNDFSCKDQDTK